MRHGWVWALGYGLLLIYGSLFPLEHVPWDTPVEVERLFDWRAARRSYSTSDLLVNLLMYLPFGWLVVSQLALPSVGWAWIIAALSGFCLSFAIEYLQLFFPARVASLGDVGINTLGTALGALAGVALHRLPLGEWLKLEYCRLVRPAPLADLGALALAFWALSEWIPLVPSLDFGNLKHGLKPLLEALQGTRPLQEAKAWAAFLNFTALGLVLRGILRPQAPLWRVFFGVFGGVLLAKVPIVGRQLSLEPLLGLVGAGLVVGLLGKIGDKQGAWLGIALIVAARIIDAQIPGEASLATYAFNWIPFAGQQNGIVGLIDILLGIWPYLVLGFFSQALFAGRRWGVAILGGSAVFALALYLEWRQQFIPGRYPDATDAYLALLAWGYAMTRGGLASNDPIPPIALATPKRSRLWLYALVALAAAFGASRLASRYQTEAVSFEDSGRLLPRPEELPAPVLPDFRFTHPRLPAPSALELWELKRRNPAYLRFHEQKAQGGDFYAIALTALADPGQIDLSPVVERLMGLRYTWRGHEQAMPIALVYDWLYSYLSPAQRQNLQTKLAEGCRYLADYIRKEALSPYNVYLYNSPFQALMAVALALYGDHPEGEPRMAFAYDLWKNRVLPVWRQVMGKNGGWHEGGEYVGIGIG
ncbi:MAG: VanZ family protein, partial [Methylohalobius sp.]